ncbi:MAG: hypothetical protein ACI4U3_09685 [Traorella sp.]
MKKKIIYVLLVILIICIGYYLHFMNRVQSLNLEYSGINGKTFHYELDSKYSCKLINNEAIMNGDTVVFECHDSYFPFLKMNVSFEIEKLIENKDINEILNSSMLLKNSYQVYMKNENDKISLYIFTLQENQKYCIRLYENLYVYENELIQNENMNEVHDPLKMTYTEISNIAATDLSFYYDLLIKQGYEVFK